MGKKKMKELVVSMVALVELLAAMGIEKAGEWFKGNRWKKKLGEGLENFPAIVEAAGDVEEMDLSEEQNSLLLEILKALEDEAAISVHLSDDEEEEEEEEEEADDEEEEEEEEDEEEEEEEEADDEEEEEEEEEEEAPAKKGSKKAPAKKEAPAKKGKTPTKAGQYVLVDNSQEDGKWDGILVSIDDPDAEDPPCTVKDASGKEWWEPLSALSVLKEEPEGFKKSSKKGSAKKDSSKKGGGSPIKKAEGKKPGVGVIGSIIEFLQKGSSKKPLTKEALLAKLADRFPDREEEAMRATINVQVPNRINREREGMQVCKNDKGYWIEET